MIQPETELKVWDKPLIEEMESEVLDQIISFHQSIEPLSQLEKSQELTNSLEMQEAEPQTNSILIPGFLGESGRFYVPIPPGRTAVYSNPDAFKDGVAPVKILNFSEWMDLKETEEVDIIIIHECNNGRRSTCDR